jgi:hypothetical protein
MMMMTEREYCGVCGLAGAAADCEDAGCPFKMFDGGDDD